MDDTAFTTTGTPFAVAPLPAALVGGCLPAVRGTSAAPSQGTAPYATGPVVDGLVGNGLVVPGLAAAVRHREPAGASAGWSAQLGDVPATAPAHATDPMTGTAALGAPAVRNTPGDLPPEDPLS